MFAKRLSIDGSESPVASVDEVDFALRGMDGTGRSKLKVLGDGPAWLEVFVNPKRYCFVSASLDGSKVFDMDGDSLDDALAAAREFAATGHLRLASTWKERGA